MRDEIKKAIETLNAGGTILYPTDTIWGIGCDATNSKAVEKIYKIKSRQKKSSFIVLVHDPKMIADFIEEVPGILWDLIDSLDFPTTIIYPKAKNLSKKVIASDGTVAIRLVKYGFTNELLKFYKKPIVSTSANFSGEQPPVLFKDISKNLIKKIDFVATSERRNIQKTKPSTIIKLKLNGEFDIIRD